MSNRIKFAGHTMGAPGRDIYQCLDLFHRIGYDGIEVRVHTKDAQINSETITGDEVKKIGAAAKKLNMEFACLTSYYKDYTDPDARPETIKQLKHVAEIASELECPLIRCYGGVEPFTKAAQKTWFSDVWTTSVSGIREVAEYAGKLGVGIVIETHVGSLTMSVRDTVRIIQDVGMSNVGMLFDYAWVETAGVEHGAEAVRAAAPYIRHVHIKDWSMTNRFPLAKRSQLMGEGTVDWLPVLAELGRIGYSGYVCDEYEKFWYPEELPEPEIGMKHNLEFVRSRLG